MCEVKQDWRDHLKSSTQLNKYMLDHGLRVDCTFRVGDNLQESQVFGCHKFLLARNSSVFDAMLYGPLAEKSESEILVTDLTPRVFSLMLDYIYTDEVQIDNFSDASALALAAHKYMLKKLQAQCEEGMSQHVDVTNVFKALEIATLLQNSTLEQECCKILQENTRILINGADFKQMPESSLVMIFSQDYSQCSEFELVQAAERWAKKQLKLRNVPRDNVAMRECLQNIIPHMRLLAMTKEEFSLGPGVQNWLSKDEKDFVLSDKKSDTPENICSTLEKRKQCKVKINATGDPSIICEKLRVDGVLSGLSRLVVQGSGFVLLGFRMFTAVKNTAVMKAYPYLYPVDQEDFYNEKININICSLKYHSTEIINNRTQYIYNIHENVLDYICNVQAKYNSSIEVMLKTPLCLNVNCKYLIDSYFTSGIYPQSKLGTVIFGAHLAVQDDIKLDNGRYGSINIQTFSPIYEFIGRKV